jgi:hypothetical protein
MKQVSVGQLKPGMVVARNVYGKNENLLLGKGTTINSGTIEHVSRLGVASLWIDTSCEKVDAKGGDAEKITKEVEEILDAQFEGVVHNPIMRELKGVFRDYLIRKRIR